MRLRKYEYAVTVKFNLPGRTWDPTVGEVVEGRCDREVEALYNVNSSAASTNNDIHLPEFSETATALHKTM